MFFIEDILGLVEVFMRETEGFTSTTSIHIIIVVVVLVEIKNLFETEATNVVGLVRLSIILEDFSSIQEYVYSLFLGTVLTLSKDDLAKV